MELLDCFKFLTDQIHSVTVATVDGEGRPETRIIDLLGCDEDGLYFTTSEGKNFHKQLLSSPYVALSGMYGPCTTECVAVSVKGEAREEGTDRVEALFDAYPYMRDLYPTAQSMSTVRVFCVYSGSLEWYDLRKKPMERLHFTFGKLIEDCEARKYALANRLIKMLVAEVFLDGDLVIPDDPKQRFALVDALLARRGDTPMSTDMTEVLQLYRG